MKKRPATMMSHEPFGRLLAIFVEASRKDLVRARTTGTAPLLPILHIDVENARLSLRSR